jgi:DNA-binding NarL/FixJ family response regulator
MLRLLAAGLANAEIAQQLFLAVGTVKRHFSKQKTLRMYPKTYVNCAPRW